MQCRPACVFFFFFKVMGSNSKHCILWIYSETLFDFCCFSRIKKINLFCLERRLNLKTGESGTICTSPSLHSVISTFLEVHCSKLIGLDWNTKVINHFPGNFHVWQQRWITKSINLIYKFTAPLHTNVLSCKNVKCGLLRESFADWTF